MTQTNFLKTTSDDKALFISSTS